MKIGFYIKPSTLGRDFVILRENEDPFTVQKLNGDGGLMRKGGNNFYDAHRNK